MLFWNEFLKGIYLFILIGLIPCPVPEGHVLDAWFFRYFIPGILFFISDTYNFRVFVDFSWIIMCFYSAVIYLKHFNRVAEPKYFK